MESNFINPEFKGAQPIACIRGPRETRDGDFSGQEILDEIAASRPDVGIVTVAPEVDGVLDLLPEPPAEDAELSAWVERQLSERAAARARRDFAAADAIRKALDGKGIVLEDTAAGTRWKRAR